MSRIDGPSIPKLQVASLVDTSKKNLREAITAGVERALVLDEDGNSDEVLDPAEGAALANAAKSRRSALLPAERKLAGFISDLGQAATVVQAPVLKVAPGKPHDKPAAAVDRRYLRQEGWAAEALLDRLLAAQGPKAKSKTEIEASDLDVDTRGLSSAEKELLAKLQERYFKPVRVLDKNEQTHTATVYEASDVRVDIRVDTTAFVSGMEAAIHARPVWSIQAKPGSRVLLGDGIYVVPKSGELLVEAKPGEQQHAVITDPGSNGTPRVLDSLSLIAPEVVIDAKGKAKGYKTSKGLGVPDRLDYADEAMFPLGKVGKHSAVLSLDSQGGMCVVLAGGKRPELIFLDVNMKDAVDQLNLAPVFTGPAQLQWSHSKPAEWTSMTFFDSIDVRVDYTGGGPALRFQSKHDKRQAFLVPLNLKKEAI